MRYVLEAMEGVCYVLEVVLYVLCATLYAGGWRLYSIRLRCWRVCVCAALYTRGCGG